MKIGTSVTVGIPTTSNARRSPEWIMGLATMQMTLASSKAIYFARDMDVADARNEICAIALQNNSEYVFMLGDDVITPNNVLLEMLKKIGRKFPSYQHPEKLVTVDMITGIYWTRSYPTEPYIYRGVMQGPYTDWLVGEFFQVDMAGCDCLLFPTEILRRIPYPWFSRKWVFENGQEPGELSTEDFYFFSKARLHGINLFADTNIQCLHEERTMGLMFGLPENAPQVQGQHHEFSYDGDGKLLVADIACGKWSPNWKNVTYIRFDGREDSGADVRCDVRNISEAYFNKFDIVHASHVLEHFAHDDIIPLVTHWSKLGKENSELWIRVPNIHNAMKKIVEGFDTIGQENHVPTNPYFYRQVWGSQEPYETAFHHWGFEKNQLVNVIKSVPGLEFLEVSETEEGLNLLIKAKIHKVKPESIGEMLNKIEKQEDIIFNSIPDNTELLKEIEVSKKEQNME